MKYIILFLLFASSSYAHKDFLIEENFGNVKVQIKTGFYYEEINKALIIGQYAKLLCDKLRFKDSITLYFRHDYVEFGNHNNGILRTVVKGRNKFRVVLEDSSYEIVRVLCIIEFMINNSSESKYDFDKIALSKPSKAISKVLSKKIYRPSKVEELRNDNGLSYYVKDCKYHMFYTKDGQEDIIITLNKVFQLSSVNSSSDIVFDTKQSFYLLNNRNKNVKKSKFNNDAAYRPYIVKSVSENKLSIEILKPQGDKIIFYNPVTGSFLE